MSTFEDYEPITLPIAAEYARKFRRYGVETADVAQELRIWLVKHPGKIEQWESEEEGADKPVARALRNEASRFCQESKAQYLGYSVEDLSWFAKGEVKALLPSLFDHDAWTEPPVSDEGGRSSKAPAEGGNWVATLADLSRAFDQLPLEDQSLLKAFHEEGYSNILLAELYDITPQAMSRRHDKAVGRLHKLLGGDRPRYTHDTPDCECGQVTGSRRVVSNAAARAAQENYYEESA